MRARIYIMLSCFFMLASCSLDDVLAPSDKVSIALMETVDTVRALPGDTVTFKFIASVNVGKLTRVEIVKKSHEFTDLRDSIRFALVDGELGLEINKEGYLSRPVSTVMMIYPVIVPENNASVGEVFSMTFKVSSNEGKSGTVVSCFKVVNYLDNKDWIWFYNTYGGTKGSLFYDPKAHKAYTEKTHAEKLKTIEVIAHTNTKGIHYCMSPGDAETESVLKANGFVNYDASTMHKTKFIKLNKESTYATVDDNFLNKMDFSQAVSKIEIGAESVVGFITEDGRKGVLNVKIQSNNPMIQSKVQSIGK